MSALYVRDPDEYAVENIVDRKMEGGKMKYLIKWEGYESKFNTWEVKHNLTGCANMLKDSNKQFDKRDAAKRRCGVEDPNTETDNDDESDDESATHKEREGGTDGEEEEGEHKGTIQHPPSRTVPRAHKRLPNHTRKHKAPKERRTPQKKRKSVWDGQWDCPRCTYQNNRLATVVTGRENKRHSLTHNIEPKNKYTLQEEEVPCVLAHTDSIPWE